MQDYRPNQVMNGSYGEVWIDGIYIAEVIAFEAKVTLEKAEVNRIRKLSKGYKVTGYDGKGSIKMNKVSSMFINMLSENMKKGRQTTATIIAKLDDPDSLGSERVKLSNCTFDELTLANWEAKKNGEESVGFTFDDWEILDSVEA